MENTTNNGNGNERSTKESYKKQSELGAKVAERKNTAFDYKQRNAFLTIHAPNQAAKHVDLVLKNRKDNQQRK
jgi:hypothetical protein